MKAKILNSVDGASHLSNLLTKAGSRGEGNVLILIAIWSLLIIVSVLHRPDFLSSTTFGAVTYNMCILGVLVIAQALVVISGGLLDLSLPVSILLSAYLAATLTNMGLPAILVIFISILSGGFVGLCNVFFIVKLKLNPLIATLAVGFVGSGILTLVFQRVLLSYESWIIKLGLIRFFEFPVTWYPMALLTVLTFCIFKYTRIGRRITAVGGNPVAAKISGISLRKYRSLVFVVSGMVSAIAGLVLTSFTPELRNTSGATQLLPVITAVVLSGFSLAGGSGNFLALFIAVGFLSTLPTALVFFGLGSFWVAFIQGMLLIFAVSTDSYKLIKLKGR